MSATDFSPVVGDRVRIHRARGGRTVMVKTGIVLKVGPTGSIYLEEDSGGFAFLASSRALAPTGQVQTVTVLPPLTP